MARRHHPPALRPPYLLERLAALTPRPRINVLLYHGILAPHAAGRAAAVAYGRCTPLERPHVHAPVAAPATAAVPAADVRPAAAGRTVDQQPGAAPGAPRTLAPEPAAITAPADPLPAPVRPSRWRWADLLQRVFAVDVLACPSCGDRMRVLATIDDPRVVRRILTHLGLLGDPGPPSGPPAWRAA